MIKFSKRCILTMIIGGAVTLGSSNAMAATFAVDYTNELQTDFRNDYDWLNLLYLSADVNVWRGLSFHAATISTAKTGDLPLVGDLLTYSNIEAGNIPLTFAKLGWGIAAGNADLFIGINNVNEDYFISPVTSFFTNSSCGISPTISCNYDIANYPLAAWCVHYRQAIGDWSVQTSLYPGQGFSRIFGHENLFNLNFNKYGVFSITSADYKQNGFYTVLGVAMHYGVPMGDGEAEPDETPTPFPQKKKFSASPWLLSEIELPRGFGLHIHGSYSTVDAGCKGYAGFGVIYSGKRIQPGVAFNYAKFTEASEYATEVTCRVPFWEDKAYLQPALHIITDGHRSPDLVGLLRLSLTL